MMETRSWKLAGGLNVIRDAITRHRSPGEMIGCMNYESREEGYRRIDGYERFDGRKQPSDILDDAIGEEATETEARRRAITKVPGTDLLAVWRYQGTTYAFSLSGDDVLMYRSSADGWVQVEYGWRLTFTTGSGTAPEAGEDFAVGATTATVIGYYQTGGSWTDGDATGVVVFTYGGDDRFAANASATIEADTARTFTISAVPTQQGITVGDAYDFHFVNHNFFGLESLERMYGVSGTGTLFEFDGTMFVELSTGVTSSNPIRVTAHQNHLFVGYPEGSITYSALGKPRLFDATEGAGEFTIGDNLSDMVAGYRDSLFVYGRNRTAYLQGSSNRDFALRILSEEAGAMPHTAVLMDQPVVVDDRGIRNVAATDEYGDFSIATLSEQIRPMLDFKRSGGALPVAATRVRRKSQYRVFFSDGDCIVMNLVRRRGYVRAEYTRSAYDFQDDKGGKQVGVVRSVCSVEDDDGRERVFFVLHDSQYCYEMDRGKSLDGQPIPYYLRLPYNDLGAPGVIKRFRKVLMEIDSTFEATFSLSADFDDDREEGERDRRHTVIGPSSFWDEMDWSAAYWNLVPIRMAGQRLHGRGRNLSLSMYSIPDQIEESHVVSGVTVYYDLRRLQR